MPLQPVIFVRVFCGKMRSMSSTTTSSAISKAKLFIIPVVFHNLSGNDNHFMIRDFLEKFIISLEPNNKEKYISFTFFDNDIKIKTIKISLLTVR